MGHQPGDNALVYMQAPPPPTSGVRQAKPKEKEGLKLVSEQSASDQ